MAHFVKLPTLPRQFLLMASHTLSPSLTLQAKIAGFMDEKLPPLGPGTADRRLEQRLSKVTPKTLFEDKVIDPDSAACCLAGIWLWNGFLDHSHELSQSIDTPEASWWHAIMHRREPDAMNAKYWFRKVGNHPLFSTLGERVCLYASKADLPTGAQWLLRCQRWNPSQFIDACETVRCSSNESLRLTLCEVAAIEWYTLFEYCQHLTHGTEQK